MGSTNNRGSITVFLTGIIVVLIIIFTVVLKVNEMNMAKVKVSSSLSSAESSILAAYQPLCFDRYHILAFDLTRGGQGEGAIEAEVQNLLEYDLGNNFSICSVELSGKTSLMENNLTEFKRQIGENFKYQLGSTAVDHLKEKIGDQDEGFSVDDELDMEAAIEHEQETIELEEMEKKENSGKEDSQSNQGNQTSDHHSDSDTGNMEEEVVLEPEERKDPRIEVEAARRMGISSLILPDDVELKDNTLTSEDVLELPGADVLISSYQDDFEGLEDLENLKDNLRGNGGWLNGLTNKAEIVCYAGSYFNNYREEKYDDTFFRCEMEYLIAGDGFDSKNLDITIRKLIRLRTAFNFVYLVRDKEKMGKLSALAKLIAPEAPFLWPIIKYILAGAWSYAEGMADAYLLTRNHKIPLTKSRETWKTGLASLTDFNNIEVSDEEDKDEKGLDYKEYLMLLIAMDTDEACLRMLDLMQLNVNKYTGDKNFRIKNACSAFAMNVCVDYKESPIEVREEVGY